MDNMYLHAAQIKLRFDTPQGQLSVEDLFDLPLTSVRANRANLDSLAQELYRRVKDEGEVTSFVDDTRKADTKTVLAFEIVKDVIRIKKEENAARTEAEAKRARKQRIMEVIERKKDESLSATSIEELEAELAKL